MKSSVHGGRAARTRVYVLVLGRHSRPIMAGVQVHRQRTLVAGYRGKKVIRASHGSEGIEAAFQKALKR